MNTCTGVSQPEDQVNSNLVCRRMQSVVMHSAVMGCPTFLYLILTNIRVADGTLLLTITGIVAVVKIDGVTWVYSITRVKKMLRNVGMTMQCQKL